MKRIIFLFLFVVASLNISAQWQATNGIEGGKINGMAACGNTVLALTDEGAFITRNNGVSWSILKLESLVQREDLTALFAVDANSVFIATKKGLLRSPDQGSSWNYSNKGLPKYQTVVAMEKIGENIFCATNDSLFISTDAGENWRSLKANLPINLYIRDLSSSGSNLIVASFAKGMFISAISYSNYQEINQGMNTNKAISVYAKDNFLAAGTNRGGIYISKNKGQQWTQSATGLPEKLTVLSIVKTEGKLFLASDKGIFSSSDDGATWTPSNLGMPSGIVPVSLVFNGSSLLVGTEGAGVFGSKNMGTNWAASNNGLRLPIAVNAFCFYNNLLYAASDGAGVFISFDGGNNWKQAGVGLPSRLKVRDIVAHDTLIFIGSDQGVFVSKNNGKSWTASSNGLSEKSVYSVLSYMNYLYAGTEKGLFVSTDYGANWIQTGNNLPLCRIHNVISKISKKEKKLFAGCAKGVFMSEDDGKTWASINTDAMKHTEVFSVFDNSRYLFAATDE
ncbi:MAG: hypothetical protein V2A54_15755, partial [Bacteroidota bacterium]